MQTLADSRTAPLREVQRAKILLGHRAGKSISDISLSVGITRRIVYKHLDRALAAGVAVALRDHPHGSSPVITPEAKAWVLSTACVKPTEFGYAAETWTRSALAKHTRREAVAAGVPLTLRRMRGRKMVITPGTLDGGTAGADESTQGAIVQAIARAVSWTEMLETGTVRSVGELATALAVDPSYVNRILKLANLAPDIVEAILEGREPNGLSLARLVEGIPTEWEEQRKTLGCATNR